MTKKINRSLSVILSFVIAFCAAFAAKSASAASYKTVTGNFNYTYAGEVLSIVNEERENYGLIPLTMTQSLTDGAMLRAAETAVSFSHTRPNGSQCFTAFKWTSAAGENIAYGQTSPREVMTSWMNSSGHRANILSTNYTTIGIGCFEYGGRLYWAQAFSGGEGRSFSKAGTRAVSVDVSLTSGTESVVTFTDEEPQNTEKTTQKSSQESTTSRVTTKRASTKPASSRQTATQKSTTEKRTTTRSRQSSSSRTRKGSNGRRSVYYKIRYFIRHFARG